MIEDIRPDDTHIRIDKHGHVILSFLIAGKVVQTQELSLEEGKALAQKMSVALLLQPPEEGE